MGTIRSKTIVLLTGAYVSHHCWDDWKPYLENKGYTVIVPPWPYKDGIAADLRRRQPDPELAKLTLPALVNYLVKIIKDLPEKPIIMGHSFGGFLTQLMVNRGLAAAGVAIHSVPPKGVFPLEWNFYKSNTAALGLFSSADITYLRPFDSWQFAFTNGMPLAEQQSSYDKLVIPESRRAIRGALSSAGAVDFGKPHVPLLFLAGTKDQCIPAKLNERNYAKYKHKGSVTDFILKEGRNHFVLGLPTWQQDADDILRWINKQ